MTVCARVGVAVLVIAASAACSSPPANPPAPAAAAAPGLKAIMVNGTVLNYIDTTGASANRDLPPIVLVHGTLGSLYEWRGQIGALAAHRRVISYSRRYHQPNTHVDDGVPWTAERHAEDLTAFIKALHLGPVELFGHSYGGTVAVELARRHPELVHSLMLGEPALFVTRDAAAGDSIRRIGAATLAGIDQARAQFAAGDSLAGLRTFVDATLGAGSYDAMPAGLHSYFMSQMLEVRKEMLAPAESWIPPLSCRDVRPLEMPVLVMVGERTLPVYKIVAQEFERCLSGPKTVVIPGVGHVHSENSPAVNAAVLAFLGIVPT